MKVKYKANEKLEFEVEGSGQKELFKDKYNICADIVFGKYKNKYLHWNCDVNKNIILKWTSSCNLNGEEGIICEFNGTGWAGWCKVNKCYLVYDTDIDNNENIVMKIIDFHIESIDIDYLSINSNIISPIFALDN